MDWIENLKVGDKVVISRRYLSKCIGIVDAVNKKTVKVSGTLYSKSTGTSHSDAWCFGCILPYTEEVTIEIKLEKDRQRLGYLLENLNITELPREGVDEFMNLIQKYTKTN